MLYIYFINMNFYLIYQKTNSYFIRQSMFLKELILSFFVGHMCHDTLFDKKNTQKYWLEI